jgi:mono/diheme cytochrome c family protein
MIDATRKAVRLAALAWGLAIAAVGAQTTPGVAETPGRLLYSTHCAGCHTTQVHWRERKLAFDRSSLAAQVRLWQGKLGLGWSDDDVAAVVDYLNAVYYGFPMAGARA